MFAHKCRNSNSRGHLCLQGISCSLGNRYSKYVFYGGVPMNVCRDFNWFLPIFYLENGIVVARTSRFAPFINYQRMNGLFHIKVRGLLLGRRRAEFLEIGWHTLPLFSSLSLSFWYGNVIIFVKCPKEYALREIVSTLPKLGKCHAGEGVEEVYHWQLQSR